MIKKIGMPLLFSLSFSAYASGEMFSGIYFDSSVPNGQARILKEDLNYLYNLPFEKSAFEFQTMIGVSQVDGAHLHNWIYNRVRYIVGESYNPRGRNLVKKKGHTFPQTPLPPLIVNRTNQYAGTIVMSNLGAELYLSGKKEKALRGIRINRKEVWASSPRVGILQIGDGLFLDRLLINKNVDAEANKIKRLSTIFHEARHSDGHSEYVGFLHDKCPTGHALSGFFACEKYANGAYSLEAAALKTLLLNCQTCSIEDQTKLTASIADALSRVTLRSHVRTEADLLAEMNAYKGIIDFYIDLIAKNPKAAASFIPELERYQAKYEECEVLLNELRTPMEAKIMDPSPEGIFQEVSIETSSKLLPLAPRK